MRPYFAAPDARVSSLRILESWLGTPYRHGTMVRGRGTDCTLLVGAWLLELGILTSVRHDYYAKDWYDHVTSDWLVESLFEHFASSCWPGLSIVEVAAPTEHGDILGFATRRRDVTSHAGILLFASDGRAPAYMIHCTQGRGVHRYEFGDCWSRRIRHAFRVMVED